MTDNGYILLMRQLLTSDVFVDRPPLHLKLWIWMLLKANWRDGKRLRRGQLFTSIAEMREAMSHKVGYRTVTPSIKEIRCAYEGLAKGTAKGAAIGITKVTRGMVITVLNYDKYQPQPKDEGHGEGHNEGHSEGPTKGIIEQKKEEGIKKDNVLVPLAGNGPASCPHQDIINLYHETLPELPQVKVWSDKRRAALTARWREDKERQSLDWWRDYFGIVRRSPFLMGQKTDFRATLEWLILPSNLPKVLEGNYLEQDESGPCDNGNYGRPVYSDEEMEAMYGR